jgi:hypothetical protein
LHVLFDGSAHYPIRRGICWRTDDKEKYQEVVVTTTIEHRRPTRFSPSGVPLILSNGYRKLRLVDPLSPARGLMIGFAFAVLIWAALAHIIGVI